MSKEWWRQNAFPVPVERWRWVSGNNFKRFFNLMGKDWATKMAYEVWLEGVYELSSSISCAPRAFLDTTATPRRSTCEVRWSRLVRYRTIGQSPYGGGVEAVGSPKVGWSARSVVLIEPESCATGRSSAPSYEGRRLYAIAQRRMERLLRRLEGTSKPRRWRRWRFTLQSLGFRVPEQHWISGCNLRREGIFLKKHSGNTSSKLAGSLRQYKKGRCFPSRREMHERLRHGLTGNA